MQMTNKNELRKKYKQIRTEMTVSERRTADLQVFKNTVSVDAYKNAKEILAYVSSEIEVDTRLLIRHSWGMGKKVLVPRCIPDSNDMEFYEIKSFDELEKGAFGIFEPKKSCLKAGKPEKPCCIVPALSYDKRGYRLGFGKGFYDKFLSDFEGVKLGLCYERCMCRQLPNDEFDISVDIVVTDESALII